MGCQHVHASLSSSERNTPFRFPLPASPRPIPSRPLVLHVIGGAFILLVQFWWSALSRAPQRPTRAHTHTHTHRYYVAAFFSLTLAMALPKTVGGMLDPVPGPPGSRRVPDAVRPGAPAPCDRAVRPKPWRSGAPPRELEFNTLVGVDSVELEFKGLKVKMFNIID